MAFIGMRSIQTLPLLFHPAVLFSRRKKIMYFSVKASQSQTATQEKQRPIAISPHFDKQIIDKISKDYEAIIGIETVSTPPLSPKSSVASFTIMVLHQTLISALFAWGFLVPCLF